jgi:hypothetical protein
LDDGFVAVPGLGLQGWISLQLLTSQSSPDVHGFCLDWFLDTAAILSETLDIFGVVARNKNNTNALTSEGIQHNIFALSTM